MTRYSKNLEAGPFGPPGYAYDFGAKIPTSIKPRLLFSGDILTCFFANYSQCYSVGLLASVAAGHLPLFQCIATAFRIFL